MKKKAFTIIELLVVISIIALIIGALVPAIRAAKRSANNLAQRCQLRDIETGLEYWQSEHNLEYPESNLEYPAPVTVGSHKLAEALVGRDLHGFDPKSSWNAAIDEQDDEIYIDDGIYENRNDVYLNQDKIAAFQIGQLYDNHDSVSVPVYAGSFDENAERINGFKHCYVLTDIFKRRIVLLPDGTTKKAGTPVLYYKANVRKKTFDYQVPHLSIYNYYDNFALMSLGLINEPSKQHPFYASNIGAPEIETFYDEITNNAIYSAKTATPYNRNTFILLSAGLDGLYGTKDDIWNISNKN